MKEVFKETNVSITVEGKKHLGAAIGSQVYLDEYVSEKMSHWVGEVVQMAEFALTQPQACYAANTFRLKHRCTYFLRTLPDIQDLLKPLENAISQVPIPVITEHRCKQLDRDVRLGGLGLENPTVNQIVSMPHQSK